MSEVAKEMLEVVALHDPIDLWHMRRLVRNRFSRDVGEAELKEALGMLEELGLVDTGPIAHEYVHITDEGWQHLGGQTPRHDHPPDLSEHINCRFCAVDEAVESDW